MAAAFTFYSAADRTLWQLMVKNL